MPFVRDALDSLEFISGPPDSRWGSLRAAMGHPQPWNVSFMAIGNEVGAQRGGGAGGYRSGAEGWCGAGGQALNAPNKVGRAGRQAEASTASRMRPLPVAGVRAALGSAGVQALLPQQLPGFLRCHPGRLPAYAPHRQL